jgi:hypothetical protein
MTEGAPGAAHSHPFVFDYNNIEKSCDFLTDYARLLVAKLPSAVDARPTQKTESLALIGRGQSYSISSKNLDRA